MLIETTYDTSLDYSLLPLGFSLPFPHSRPPLEKYDVMLTKGTGRENNEWEGKTHSLSCPCHMPLTKTP